MSKRGRGRGGAPSGSFRGGNRGGRGGSRNASGRTTPARNSGKASRSFAPPPFEGHGGLGFFQGSKSNSKSNNSIDKPRNPLLEPMVFVKGSVQAFDMKVEEPKPEPELVQAFEPEPSSSKIVEPVAEPTPVQDTAQRSDSGGVTPLVQDNAFFVIDTTGDLPQASTSQTQLLLPATNGHVDSEDEDEIVYVPPTQPHKPTLLPPNDSSRQPSPSVSPQPKPESLPATDTERVMSDNPIPPSVLLAQAQEREAKESSTSASSKPVKEKITYNEKRRRKREARKRRESGQQLPRGFANVPNGKSKKQHNNSHSTSAASSDRDDAVVQDYLLNTSRRDADETGEMDEDPDVDAARMLSFVNGMSTQPHTTIDDLEDAQQAELDARYFEERERGGWETEEDGSSTPSSEASDSSTSSTDSEEAEALAEVDIDVEHALAEQLGLYSDDEDEEEEEASDMELDVEIEEEDNQRQASMGVKGRLHTRRHENAEEDGYSSDDPFAGGQSWQHDIDAAYIMDTVQLAGSSKSSRKKEKQKLKAMSRGELIELDDANVLGVNLDEDDIMDDVLLQAAEAEGRRKSKGKGKKKQPQFDSDDEFFDELQAAWEADRASKAERKRARLEARLATQPSKKTVKAAKRAGLEAPNFHGLKGFNIHAVHEQIRQFVLSGPSSKSDLTLSPMDKRDRVTIHLLAEAYGLKSQSRGSGTKRFPCLSRTTRTSALLSPTQSAKIEHILAVSEGRQKASVIGKGGYKNKGLWKALSGMEVSDADPKRKIKITGHHKNKEGDVVGGTADHLQNDNVGYRLLARMGWNHGQSMGATGSGIAVPLAATIKHSKKGLGSKN